MNEDAILRMTQWAIVWSPLASTEERMQAWQALELEGDGPNDEFWGLFHNGAPSPRVPLLFHAALGIPGDGAREDWMRSLSYLGLEWKERMLPPDHLAVACDVLAFASQQGETVLVRELIERYLTRWVAHASARLEDSAGSCANLPEYFLSDIKLLAVTPQ